MFIYEFVIITYISLVFKIVRLSTPIKFPSRCGSHPYAYRSGSSIVEPPSAVAVYSSPTV